ncbi:MAG: fumarylacetoacetate hydrolase family protein [Pirellulales bacterium]|nr:fumarylacetoacetate hydrolase family protein [Pirellulales bacterium]
MRLVTFQSRSGPRSAVLREASADSLEVVDLNANDARLPPSIKALLELGDSGLKRAEDVGRTGKAVPGGMPQLLPPVVAPQKIVCVGLNYADHAAETGAKVGEEPVIFCKFPTTLRGHEQPIELPPESREVDYEAELVVVIARQARRVSRAEGMEHVAGYTCGHDVSARDWQKGKPGKQWLLGKSFDSFAPLGPALVTRDEVDDPGNLAIQMRLNGELMQDSNTSQLIFPIDYLVSYLSHVCTLFPGDLIFTGTPPGVGMARQPPLFLQPGDTAEVSIEKLGTLRNPVIAAT